MSDSWLHVSPPEKRLIFAGGPCAGTEKRGLCHSLLTRTYDVGGQYRPYVDSLRFSNLLTVTGSLVTAESPVQSCLILDSVLCPLAHRPAN